MDSKGAAPVVGVEAEVASIGVTGVVEHSHGAGVVVLVKATHRVANGQTVMNEHIVSRIIASQLETVSIAHVGVMLQRHSHLGVIARRDRSAVDLVKPSLVDLITRMSLHVVFSRTVLVTDAVLQHCFRSRDPLKEIPAIVRVIPCTTTDIMVAGTGKLFVGKTICIASEVSLSLRIIVLIIKVVVTIYILYDVVSTILHLAARIRRTVDVQPLEQAVTALVVQVIFSGISECQVLDMQVGAIG